MAGKLNSPALHRDYGATSSSNASAITSIPDVNFPGFSHTEFMSLSDNIASNISSVNSSCKQLEKDIKVIGKPQDTQAFRDKVHHLQSQTNIRIQMTSKVLKNLTAVVSRADKQQKLQLEKLTNDFRQVVEKYSESQQKIARAMKQVLRQSLIAQLQDEEKKNTNADDPTDLIQKQKLVKTVQQFKIALLVDQENRIKEIEADVSDVNAILQGLASLVQEQGAQIDKVENSIEITHDAVTDGTAELTKGAGNQARYRRKILILLAIAVILGLIVTGIIVGKLSN